MSSGKKGAAGWRTHGGSGVVVGEPKAFLGKLIEMGSLDFFLPVTADFTIAKVIC
jgi:hypothetical protein